ncbi:hypothetical protein Bbelb_429710 [Branchiostoma belcheri]|nr:hypothetical protein Bbelb_429710 [Branchiostoma belcheri]
MARRLSARRESFAYMRRLSTKFGPLRFQLAEIGDRPVRRCPALVTSSLATGETVGRARTAAGGVGDPTLCAWPTHLARAQKFGPLRFQLAEIGGPSRPEMSGLVTSSLATGETLGRARHSCRWRPAARLYALGRRTWARCVS